MPPFRRCAHCHARMVSALGPIDQRSPAAGKIFFLGATRLNVLRTCTNSGAAAGATRAYEGAPPSARPRCVSLAAGPPWPCRCVGWLLCVHRRRLLCALSWPSCSQNNTHTMRTVVKCNARFLYYMLRMHVIKHHVCTTGLSQHGTTVN